MVIGMDRRAVDGISGELNTSVLAESSPAADAVVTFASATAGDATEGDAAGLAIPETYADDDEDDGAESDGERDGKSLSSRKSRTLDLLELRLAEEDG